MLGSGMSLACSNINERPTTSTLHGYNTTDPSMPGCMHQTTKSRCTAAKCCGAVSGDLYITSTGHMYHQTPCGPHYIETTHSLPTCSGWKGHCPPHPHLKPLAVKLVQAKQQTSRHCLRCHVHESHRPHGNMRGWCSQQSTKRPDMAETPTYTGSHKQCWPYRHHPVICVCQRCI